MINSRLQALKNEADPTVLRRAVDVLYGVCTEANVEKIVKDLLMYGRRQIILDHFSQNFQLNVTPYALYFITHAC